MPEDLGAWTPRARPERVVLDGRFVRIEPLEMRHLDGLFAEVSEVDTEAERRFTWLFETPPASREELRAWLERVVQSADPLFFAVIDKASGRVAGRQALMRIDQAFGVIEIGSIYWGPTIARKPAATEALYLMARYVFDDLGYRRFEWKCNNENEPSKRAALRFGFQAEGVFRQHMVVKGKSRDTAWFAMIDKDWPALRARYEAWLDPANFDADGRQRRRLQDCR
ncbi:GNAT family N-acetyltransferase [Tabrizicola sp. BL-A-41-H6]|uniref:GNAT family N-acetyltransferase n=1 Tax=Tabrizicola sp. BL-A-41-H6 TaxID=3421107 RepID=UPI003D671B51